jgi:hypothetical protein
MPGHIATTQALHLAKALARREQGRFTISTDVIGDKIRVVV